MFYHKINWKTYATAKIIKSNQEFGSSKISKVQKVLDQNIFKRKSGACFEIPNIWQQSQSIWPLQLKVL